MNKRVCETCRHYKAAGFDNMGWCNHPKRRTGNDVKILARPLELQCRNDWDHDLWQPKGEAGASDVDTDHVVGPVAPATREEIAFLATAESLKPIDPNTGVDVVVQEVTQGFSVNGAGAHGDGFKVGYRKAHEQLKARQRVSRDSIQPIPGFADAIGAGRHEAGTDLDGHRIDAADGEVIVNNQTGSQPRPVIGEVSPVALGEMGRPFPKITSFPEDDAVFTSIPEPVAGFELPLASKTPVDRVVRRAGFDEDDREIKPWNHELTAPIAADPVESERVVDPYPVAAAAPVREPEWAAEPELDRVIEPAPIREREHRPTGDRAGRRANRAAFDLSVFASDLSDNGVEIDAQMGDAMPERPARRDRAERSTEPVIEALTFREERVVEERIARRPEPRPEITLRDEVAPEPVRDRPAPRRPIADDDYLPVAEARPQREQRRATRIEPVQRDVIIDELANDEPEIRGYRPRPAVQELDDVQVGAAPEASIPRMCRTCRDFRPAESGERGWCTNKWAFSHRRMVDAEELPCETTIGRWWLPHDDHWATAVDISGHSKPTPHLDQWLAQRAVMNGEIDAPTQIRRRQR